MTTVLRIEHPKWKRGPYIKTTKTKQSITNWRLLKAYSEMRDAHDDDCAGHPVPFLDTDLGGIRDNELCGFKDAEQLCEWFMDEELVLLMDIGFEIIEVPARDIRYGDKQVLFKKVGE